MVNVKELKNYLINHKALVSLFLGISSMVTPIAFIVIVILFVVAPMFLWVIMVLGMVGVFFGVREQRKRGSLDQRGQDHFPVIFAIITIIIMVISFSMIIYPGLSIVWLVVGWLASVVGIVLGIIELVHIMRLPLEKKSQQVHNRKIAIKGIIFNVIGFVLHVSFALTLYFITMLFASTLVNVMHEITSLFSGNR